MRKRILFTPDRKKFDAKKKAMAENDELNLELGGSDN